MFSIAMALMTIGMGIWNLSAKFTSAMGQHDQIIKMTQQSAEEARRNSENMLLLLQKIDGKKCK